jgi:hypothetical protein
MNSGFKLPWYNYETGKIDIREEPYLESAEAAYSYLPTDRARHLYDLYLAKGITPSRAYRDTIHLCLPAMDKYKEVAQLADAEGQLVAYAEAIAHVDELLEPEIERLEQ